VDRTVAMKHPFQELRAEYELLLSTARVNPTVVGALRHAAEILVRNKSQFLEVQHDTRVPAALLMGLMWRERNGDLRYYLGNGQPLTQRTTIVPIGRGPFAPPHDGAWKRGAKDAISVVHLDKTTAPWSWAYVCWKGEAWNGFGPRAHGIHTGYLWAGTNHYVRGKYVADGRWDASHVDTQLGMIPVVRRAIELDQDLEFDHASAPVVGSPSPAPTPVPEAVSGGQRGTRWLQAALNELGAHPPLRTDGSYGRASREAVRAFQHAHHLTADGLAGGETLPVIEKALTPDMRERIGV
jgi:lysozyme family protein